MSEYSPVRIAAPRFAVDGQDQPGLAGALVSLEVHIDEQGLSTFDARFENQGAQKQGGPGFLWFDGDALGLGRSISAAVGHEDEAGLIFHGLITAVEGIFSQTRAPELRVRAEDALFGLRMNRRTRLFEQSTDAEIVDDVARDASLKANIDAPGPTHKALLHINQSDLALLRDRARAVDAMIGVDEQGVQLHRRGPSTEDPIVLSTASNLLRFNVSADLAHQRTELSVHGWSVSDKDGIHCKAGADEVKREAPLGTTGPAALNEMGIKAPEHHVLECPSTEEEAKELASALMLSRARRFVTGRGTTNGVARMRVGSDVEVVDVGPWFTGRYRVRAVNHTFDRSDGFLTHFTATRASLGGGL